MRFRIAGFNAYLLTLFCGFYTMSLWLVAILQFVKKILEKIPERELSPNPEIICP